MHLETREQLVECLKQGPERILRVTANADYVVEDRAKEDTPSVATVDLDVAESLVKEGSIIEPEEFCGTWKLAG